jgi:hypothetical protein
VIEERTTVRKEQFARRLVPLLLAAAIVPVPGATARPSYTEITHTSKGRALVAEQAERARQSGRVAPSERLRVWELGIGDHFIAERLPLNFSVHLVRDEATGVTSRQVRFDVEGRLRAPQTASLHATAAGSPSWLWLDQYCFHLVGNSWGYIDPCYLLHGMVNERDPRDFYSLEQYGTVGAKPVYGAGIYSGFLEASRASTSAPMSWIDWKPRGSITGSCQSISLSVSALGVSLPGSGVMCERWTIYKSTAAGGFRETWSCGCPIGTGPAYPNTREVDYVQVVSVPNGGVPRWTLSAGVHAR